VSRREKMRNETAEHSTPEKKTLVDRTAQRRLTWSGHISRMGSERLPVKVTPCSIIVRRNQGRQRKKWIENIKEDTDTRQIRFEEVMAIVHDRAKWRSLEAVSSSFA